MATPLRTEQEWARQYPVPESTVEDILVSLWNFPVARTDLAPEHRAALKQFLANEFMQLTLSRATTTQLFVRGHASDSGEEPANIALSRERAEKAARFLVSEGFPARQVRAEWAGSSEPADPGSSGYAAARNRRVDIVRFAPSEPAPLPPTDIEPPPPPPKQEPGFKIPTLPGPSSLTVDIPLDIPLPPIKTAVLIIEGKMGGTLKVKVDDKGGGWGGGAAIKDGKLVAKFEAKIKEDLKAKVSFEPPSRDKSMVLKVGGEFKIGHLDSQIGVQSKLNFLYFEFSFEAFTLPEIELGDVHVSMTLKPTLKIEVGPGPAMIARLAPLGAAAGEILASAAGPLAVAILVNGGTIYAIEYAKEESVRFTQLLARREGVAARVAYEIVGVAAEADFAERRSQWRNTSDRMGPAFDEGVGAVNALIKDPATRDKKRSEWAQKFAADGAQNFTEIRTRVFEAIGKYENNGETEAPVTTL